jgi:hypothetical protein
MGTVTYITKITNPRIWVRSKIFMTGQLSGTNSLRGAEADTPLTLPSKASALIFIFLFILFLNMLFHRLLFECRLSL